MTIERWKTFSRHDQLFTIGAEFERARVSERDGNREYRRGALERAIALIDLTLGDIKWQDDRPMLEGLKSAVQEFVSDDSRTGVAIFYEAL